MGVEVGGGVKLKDCEEPIPEGKSAQAASFATHANQIEVGVGQCVKFSLERPTLPLDQKIITAKNCWIKINVRMFLSFYIYLVLFPL